MPGMSDLPWFKVYNKIIDDPKLHCLDDAVKWRFMQLLVLANECNNEGYLTDTSHSLTNHYIAWRLHQDIERLEEDLQTLAESELIRFDDSRNAWLIPSFARRQDRPPENERTRWRETKRRQRARLIADKQEQSSQTNLDLPASPSETHLEVEDVQSKFSKDEDIDEDIHNDLARTAEDNVLLKKRREKKRIEERRREERSSHPARPAGSALDQLEQELRQKPTNPSRRGAKCHGKKSRKFAPRSPPFCMIPVSKRI
jgi:hypothetical protein